MNGKNELSKATDVDLAQFLPAFFEEANENLQQIESTLLRLRVDQPELPSNDEMFGEVFRHTHSIKGNSATFGFSDISSFAHHLEKLLDRLRKHELTINESLLDVLLEAVDQTKILLESHMQSPDAMPIDSSHVVQHIDYWLQANNHACADNVITQTYHDNKTPILTQHPTDRSKESMRVGVAKVDQLVDLVGELIITQSMITQQLSPQGDKRNFYLISKLNDIKKQMRILQDAVQSIRMMPMSELFNRFSRLAHNLSHEMNKNIVIKFYGETTEFDKSIMEFLIDPLTHLIRNSCDHGIELPSDRTKANKSDFGTITVGARHRGGMMEIKVHDDGCGLNKDKIIKKAKEMKINISKEMSETDIFNLIFTPGFSTAKEVSSTSGRGVGMDVVIKNINQLQGQVKLESKEGAGTTVTLYLPITFAIMDAVIIRLGTERYIIPMHYLMDSFPYTDHLIEVENGIPFINRRNHKIPFLDISELLNIKTPIYGSSRKIVSILSSEGMKVAIAIDEIVSKQQIYIKDISNHYKKIKYISDASILGDGSVSLIIDCQELLRHANNSR